MNRFGALLNGCSSMVATSSGHLLDEYMLTLQLILVPQTNVYRRKGISHETA